jgi:antitoxin component YwqK of YwqJK toxin-antitoxin module
MEKNKEIRKENLINLFDENGKRHGYWESYWDNGQLFCKGNYVNGKLHGYWESYFDNGQLYYKGFYDMGNRVDYNPDEAKVVELTLDEIAIKFNIPVEQLKIKK